MEVGGAVVDVDEAEWVTQQQQPLAQVAHDAPDLARRAPLPEGGEEQLGVLGRQLLPDEDFGADHPGCALPGEGIHEAAHHLRGDRGGLAAVDEDQRVVAEVAAAQVAGDEPVRLAAALPGHCDEGDGGQPRPQRAAPRMTVEVDDLLILVAQPVKDSIHIPLGVAHIQPQRSQPLLMVVAQVEVAAGVEGNQWQTGRRAGDLGGQVAGSVAADPLGRLFQIVLVAPELQRADRPILAPPAIEQATGVVAAGLLRQYLLVASLVERGEADFQIGGGSQGSTVEGGPSNPLQAGQVGDVDGATRLVQGGGQLVAALPGGEQRGEQGVALPRQLVQPLL